MNTQRVTFTNREGHSLRAHLDLPAFAKPKQYVLLAHCFTCGKDLKGFRNISKALTQNDFAVFRFDFTGLGQSEGDFAETTFSSNITDLLDAAAYLKENYQAPSLLVGHSLGGAAAILAARHLPTLKALVSIGSPSHTSHVKNLFGTAQEEIQAKGEAQVVLAGRKFTFKQEFIQDLEEHNPLKALKELRLPYLNLHAPHDEIVAIKHAQELYVAAMHPKSFVSLDSADHLLSDENDAVYAGQLIASWAKRYLPEIESEVAQTQDSATANLHVEDGFTTHMQVGGHYLLADEPTKVGGKNKGPNPFEFLAGGLSACTAMTLRMYIDHKKWPVDQINVLTQHHKIEREEAGKSIKQDVFKRKITYKGSIDAKQEQRLLAIANRCPVHKTLMSVSEIETEINQQNH